MAFACIEDLRLAAKRKLPKVFFDYVDGGAFGEKTATANVRDFDALLLEQRVLTGIYKRDLSVTILGKTQALPLILGPVGFSGLLAPQGEILAARAANEAGVPYCPSNFSVATIEELRAATDRDLWFQLYILKDRTLTRSFVERAANAGVQTLCITVDGSAGRVGERDVRNGFQRTTTITPRLLAAMLTKPRWCLEVALGGVPKVGNLADRPEFGNTILQQATHLANQVDPTITWDDVRRLRDTWKGKLVVKGVLHVEDAHQAVSAGADAIVVSNHGGRDLDGAPSTITVLPEIADAVGALTDVLMDSGIRRGSDIVKALALGAKGVMIGRAYAFGLAAAGQDGVAKAIDMLRTELDITMAHMGVANTADLYKRRKQLVRVAPLQSDALTPRRPRAFKCDSV